VWTVNTFSLTSLPWEKSCCSCARYVVNIYLMSRSPCTLVKFSLVGGYIHEQIVLVQKLPWVSLEQCSCTRKNRHFRRTREQIFFYLNIFIHGNLSDILRLSVLEMWQMWQSCKFASTIRLRIHLLSCERSSHARDWRETRAHISDSCTLAFTCGAWHGIYHFKNPSKSI
jgi:hypothetical protein